MTITASCCKAHDFPDDDAIAIDYSDVCNSAPAGRTAAMGLTGLVALLSVTAYLMSA